MPLELSTGAAADDEDEDENQKDSEAGRTGENSWVEITVEIPGFRDDDAMPVFLAALLSEALLADGEFTSRLWINSRFHWRLYIDVCIMVMFRVRFLTMGNLGLASFAAAFISASITVLDDAFGAVVYAVTTLEVGTGRGSVI